MEQSQIILKFEEIQIQLRHLHWQTKSFARHKAYGELYEDLTEKIDDFVEICMGKHGRPSFPSGYLIEGKDISELSVNEFLSETCEFLIHLNNVYDRQMDSDLLNIRDEILGKFNKLKYLLTLK
jgi:DNA-binding ferritin-like protein